MKVVFALIVFSVFSSQLAAQCATGVNTGGGNCIPPDAAGMPGYNNGASQVPSAPRPVWADQWGAIVMDRQTSEAGTVANRSSKAEAIKDAMHDCASQGAKNCEVLITYYNQCAALAAGTRSLGAASNADEAAARDEAVASCSKRAPDCTVAYSACSVARRVR